jgi:crossover junction endodeoxyribonuclease RusA
VIIRLPFPAPELFPNRKNGKHWKATVAIKEAQKDAAIFLTKQAMQTTHSAWPDGSIPLSLVYLTPDKRKRDIDNMLAASKALLDGMAQALGVDDSRFRPILIDVVSGNKEGALLAAVGVQIISGISFGGLNGFNRK